MWIIVFSDLNQLSRVIETTDLKKNYIVKFYPCTLLQLKDEIEVQITMKTTTRQVIFPVNLSTSLKGITHILSICVAAQMAEVLISYSGTNLINLIAICFQKSDDALKCD